MSIFEIDDQFVEEEFIRDGVLKLTKFDCADLQTITMIFDYLCRHRGKINAINMHDTFLSKQIIDLFCDRIEDTGIKCVSFTNNGIHPVSQKLLMDAMPANLGFELTISHTLKP